MPLYASASMVKFHRTYVRTLFVCGNINYLCEMLFVCHRMEGVISLIHDPFIWNEVEIRKIKSYKKSQTSS